MAGIVSGTRCPSSNQKPSTRHAYTRLLPILKPAPKTQVLQAAVLLKLGVRVSREAIGAVCRSFVEPSTASAHGRGASLVADGDGSVKAVMASGENAGEHVGSGGEHGDEVESVAFATSAYQLKACEPSKAEQRWSHMGGEDGNKEMYSQIKPSAHVDVSAGLKRRAGPCCGSRGS